MCLQWRRRRAEFSPLSLHLAATVQQLAARHVYELGRHHQAYIRPGFQASLDTPCRRNRRPSGKPAPAGSRRKLFKAHPDARCALDHRNAFELLCATVLSAQCTDERVNRVTPALFKRFPDAEALAAARTSELEKLVKSTGFYKNKAKSLSGFARALVESHGGRVPWTMEELVELPGVGRKTANVILGNVYETPGIVVDTHVSRVSQRLGLTANTDPEKIEADLMELVARKDWTKFLARDDLPRTPNLHRAQAAVPYLSAVRRLPVSEMGPGRRVSGRVGKERRRKQTLGLPGTKSRNPARHVLLVLAIRLAEALFERSAPRRAGCTLRFSPQNASAHASTANEP
jgi:endonuclease-3